MPSLAALADAHQERLLARADRTADAAERAVRKVWLALMAAIKAGGPWFQVQRACVAALRSLPEAAHIVAEDLAGVAQDSARWTAETIAEKLTDRQALTLLRRRGLIEAERGDLTDLLIGVILPPISAEQVNQVLFAHGWLERLKSLTRLADPITLASRIASLVQDGVPISTIAREIRPVVQGVQTAARRTARTAGLWIAHSAELHTYETGLPELIEGYQVRAVLDHATRPEHRKRDGRKYYREPKSGQKGFGEMPRPPREADGTWSFNCRCWLSPILAAG